MADKQITTLTALTSVASGDEIPIYDISAGGEAKKITQDNLIPDATTSTKGKVQLASDYAEIIAGVNTTHAVTPNDLQSKIDNDTSLSANSNQVIPSQKAVKAYCDRPLNTTLTTLPLRLSQGSLINCKIVPSVASNNLTVALKTLAGSDPSATDPVYCRVGDTIRSVTSALSVTKNAATNWCNAGSAELATKEIDYFVYLGYNATDGVVLGFSRYPGASQYSDFSVTTTNEKYCAISTITTAASTDYYEVIGRFAATLSAGAGYTWSVPTFTAENLVQRPIYETRNLSWLPTYSASGSMTWTSVTTTSATYKLTGKVCDIFFRAAGTTGGTASTELRFSTPVSTTDTNLTGCGNTGDTAFQGGGATYFASAAVIGVVKQAVGNWGLGASRRCETIMRFPI